MKTYRLKLNNKIYEVDIELLRETADMTIVEEAAAPAAATAPAVTPAPAAGDGEEVLAPLPGKVIDIKVNQGAQVKKGDILAILEAMKLENEIFAPCDGVVSHIKAMKGNNVNTGDCLLVLA